MSVNMLLISGAVKAGTSKTGKKIITAIASCLVIIVFLLIAFTTNTSLLPICISLGKQKIWIWKYSEERLWSHLYSDGIFLFAQ